MKHIWKSIGYAAILTICSILVFILNLVLDRNGLQFIATFQQLKSSHFIPPLIMVLIWYLFLFTILFTIGFLIQARLEKKYNKKFTIWIITLPFLFILITRSIIIEPYLYQTFYDTFRPFTFFMDGILFFDIKWLIDLILLGIITAGSVLLLKRYAIVIIGIILITILPKPVPFVSEANAETIIILMPDTLRKDIIEQDQELFLHELFNKSTIIENMYTTFPASVPAMAGIFTQNYSYKYRGTALSLDKPLELTFINSLKKDYLLSLHTDFTDEIGYRKNFNIPFDEILATNINFKSSVYASTLSKNVVLMSFINSSGLRNLLIPQLYGATNPNSDKTVTNAIEYLSSHRKDKKIAFVFLGDTHIPYRAIYPYYRPFLADQTGKQFKWSFDYEDFVYHGESSKDNQNIKNLYKMSTRKIDNHIEQFIVSLEQTNLLSNTTMVLFSDQGENLFDNNLDLYSHNNIDTKHVLNVPFAIYRKDKPAITIKEGNYSLNDTLNIALNPDRISEYKKTDIYIEADLDLHNENNPLYVGNISYVLDTTDLNSISILHNDILQKYKKRALVKDEYILTYHPINNPPYALYHLPSDPLFQSDQQKNQPSIFASLKQKLDEYIEDTKRY